MRYWVSLAFVLVLAISICGCPSKNNPASPNSGSTPTPTPSGPTATPTPTGAFSWSTAQVYRINNLGTVTQQANITLQLNGAANSGVTAVLTGSNLSTPVTLPYVSNITLSGKIYSSYYTNTGFTYAPGQTYTLSTYYGTNSASATLTAPGGITNAADGSQASWTSSGAQNLVSVTNSGSVITFNSTTYSATVTSPYSIPATAYGGGGVFGLSTECDTSTSNVLGATPAFFIVSDTLVTSVTTTAFTPTNAATSTPSSTPTVTPTKTPSSTPTLTPSNTSTNTITFTPTLTGTFTSTPTCNSTCDTYTPTYTFSATSTPSATSTSSTTNTATKTATSTATQTATVTPYPTLAFSTSWSENYLGQLSATSFSGGQLYAGHDNLGYIINWTTLTGTEINDYANQGVTNGQFELSQGVATDTVGDIFVADELNNNVQELNSIQQWQWTIPTGGVTTAGSGVSQFNSPRALVFDGAGTIYVADSGNGRIVALNANSGAWITSWNGSASNATTFLGYPDSIAYDPTNKVLYVGDSTSSVGDPGVFKYSTSGTLLKYWEGSVPISSYYLNPYGVAVNNSGTRVYVTDGQNSYLEMFDASGNYLTGWGGNGSGNYQFGTNNPSPEGVAVDTSGKVYVSDPGNGYVKVYTGTP